MVGPVYLSTGLGRSIETEFYRGVTSKGVFLEDIIRNFVPLSDLLSFIFCVLRGHVFCMEDPSEVLFDGPNYSPPDYSSCSCL